MALLFMDGFDVYDDQADVVAGGISKVEGATHTFSTSAGRFGGGAIGGTGTFPGWGVPVNKAPGEKFWFSFAYWHNGMGSNSGNGDYWIYPRDNSTAGQNFQLFHRADGGITIIAQNGTVAAGPTGTALTANTWHWVEVEIVLATSAQNDGSVSVSVDGNVVVSASGIDTYVSGNNTGNIGFYGSSGAWYADDIIINDDQGGVFDTPPGDCRIDSLRPTSDGGVTDWTGSYTDVDDALGSSDGDSTYIESNTVAQESRFGLSDPAPSGQIFAVQPRVKSKNTDVGARAIRTLINSGGTEALGGTFTPDTTYKWRRGDFFFVDPDTSSAFDDAGINALEAGVEVVS